MNVSPSSLKHEIRLAGVVCGVGLAWAVQTWSASFLGFRAIELTPGPLDLCSLGILLWLWARWHMAADRRQHAAGASCQAAG